MDRYYLWDNNLKGIDISQSVRIGFESPFLVKVKFNGLEAALRDLTEKAKQYGKKRFLEVHCHGHPAALHLSKPYGVTNSDVHIVGAWLRNVVQPGGLIELLACWVAAQGETGEYWQMIRTPKTQIAGYREDYHGVLKREAQARSKNSTNGAARSLIFKPQTPQQPRGLVFAPLNPLKEDPKSFFNPILKDDGLKFCLTLARTSLCRVRAGITVQLQEDDDTGPLDNPIGSWENEVFDFYPNGQIKFVGNSPYRGSKMNSYDMDRLTA